MRQLRRLYEGVGGKIDVSLDVELFIRLLEWAKEEAQNDVQLHDLVENVERLCGEHGELSMEHYDEIVSGLEQPQPDSDPDSGTPED